MERLGGFFARIAQRVLPDPFVIAAGLTLVAILIGVAIPQTAALRAEGIAGRLLAIARSWFDGVWDGGFLAFALQMCVVLLAGFGLAKAPGPTALLRRVAGAVGSGRGAVLCVAGVSCIGCWINWGFGLVAAGLLAREIRRGLARRRIPCNYALVVATAYSGMMIWHGGLSGSAPLKVAENGVAIQRRIEDGSERIELPPIGVDRTILSRGNLLLTGVFWAGIPLVLLAMSPASPRSADRVEPEPLEQVDKAPRLLPEDATVSPAQRLNRSRLIPMLVAGIGLIALAGRARGGLRAIDLNFVNLLFIALGLLLHRNLEDYIAAVTEGGRAVVGIVLQFPLYGGIQGVLVGTGIAAAFSEGFVDVSQWLAAALGVSPGLPFAPAALASAGLVNLFIPSGGGQWIVQGPIMCAAADALGLPVEQAVMAVSYGDQWTNMIQPFWAIPLMGLTGVNVREFMGYCALLMLLAGPVFLFGLAVFY